MVFGDYPRVVRQEAGPGTVTGSGDILEDSNGRRWRVIDEWEVANLRSGTACGLIATLYPDGTIR